jgi:phytoene dehydrogenase-like protein
MIQNRKKIVVIGGGIAGLCAAVYALRCGYEVELLEMHDMAGGLAMSWRRGPYTFETCLHWLVGSSPHGEFHAQWQEVCDIEKLTFVNPEEFVRIESLSGDTLTIHTNVDRLETELFRRAPQDAAAIRDFTRSVRTLGKFRMLDPSGGLAENWLNMLRDLPIFPLLGKLSKMSGEHYGNRFFRSAVEELLRNRRYREDVRDRHDYFPGVDELRQCRILHRRFAGAHPADRRKDRRPGRKNPFQSQSRTHPGRE